MATHKYTPGQSVWSLPQRYQDGSSRGVYTIVTKLPEAGNVPQGQDRWPRAGGARRSFSARVIR